MPNVALTCPSSFTSWILAESLLRRGHSVRVLSRTTSRVVRLLEHGAQVVRGNLLDDDSLEELFAGAATAYVVTPASGDPGSTYETDIAEVLARAVRATDVEHIVYLSALGADQPGDVELLQSKASVEQVLLDTGRDVTILRPGIFMDNLWLARPVLVRGRLAMPNHPDTKLPIVAARDVALNALFTMTQEAGGCAAYDLPGPCALTPAGIAGEIGRVWARPIRYDRLSEPDFERHLVHLGISSRRARLLTRILADYGQHEAPSGRTQWTSLAENLHQPVTTLEVFAEELRDAWQLPAPAMQAVGQAEGYSATGTGRSPDIWVPS